MDTSPFEYQPIKNDKVLIYWHNKLVVTLAGSKAQRFLEQIADADEATAQLVMARFTGNFKRGNERDGKNR